MITIILRAKDFEVMAKDGHKQLEGTFKHSKLHGLVLEYKQDGITGKIIHKRAKIFEF